MQSLTLPLSSSPLISSRRALVGTAPVLLAASIMGAPTAAFAEWIPDYQVYSIERLGLLGSSYASSDGAHWSYATRISASGAVAGYTRRYSGTSARGEDAWIFNGFQTIQVGLWGADHTSSGGVRTSRVTQLNAAGQAVGYSSVFLGDGGKDSWIWDGSATQRIGLSGAGYTGVDGRRISEARFLNQAGEAAGVSSVRGSGWGGTDAWVWNGESTVRVGFWGAGYEAPEYGNSGWRQSEVVAQTETGHFAGLSTRFRANMDNGYDAWAWNGSDTVQIGLTGGDYTRDADGFRSSSVYALVGSAVVAGSSMLLSDSSGGNIGRDTWVWNGNSTIQVGLLGSDWTGSHPSSEWRRSSIVWIGSAGGQVAGTSERDKGGADSWVWDGETTRQVGLTGGVYSWSISGWGVVQESRPTHLNASGQAAGWSRRHGVGGANLGRDSWVSGGGTTNQVGLVGGEYCGSGGYQYSGVRFLNSSGHAVGSSDRITGAQSGNGQDVWYWDGTSTRQMGMTGGIGGYTGTSGYQYSQVIALNDLGHAAGWSRRMMGDSANGQVAWYYDSTTQHTYGILGSFRLSDKYTFSEATLLTDEGFLLGNYTYFAEGVGPAEQRAFIFRPDLGITDLGTLVEGGLTLSGWQVLQRPVFSNALATIVGYGYVKGQTSGQSVFLMTANPIPAPAAGLIATLCGFFTLRRRRR
jgi:hypothetical protein